MSSSQKIGGKVHCHVAKLAAFLLLSPSQTKLVFYLESLDYTFLNPLNPNLSPKKSPALSFPDILCRETSKLASSSTYVEHNLAHTDPFLYPPFHL